LAAVIAFVLAGAAVGGWLHFHNDHGTHDHDGHGAAALTLNDGRRWATDAPLRAGMLGIRDAVTPVLAAHADKRLTPGAAQALAGTVQNHVNNLFANCKLPPKADATLHVILTDVLSGTAQLAAPPSSTEGANLLTRALQRYPEYFDHPGWSPTSASQR
jgi:hypothetical protein